MLCWTPSNSIVLLRQLEACWNNGACSTMVRIAILLWSLKSAFLYASWADVFCKWLFRREMFLSSRRLVSGPPIPLVMSVTSLDLGSWISLLFDPGLGIQSPGMSDPILESSIGIKQQYSLVMLLIREKKAYFNSCLGSQSLDVLMLIQPHCWGWGPVLMRWEFCSEHLPAAGNFKLGSNSNQWYAIVYYKNIKYYY